MNVAESGKHSRKVIEPIQELVFTDTNNDENILSPHESLRVLEAQSASSVQLSQWLSVFNELLGNRLHKVCFLLMALKFFQILVHHLAQMLKLILRIFFLRLTIRILQ